MTTALRALLRFVGSVLCVSGVLLLIDAAVTVAWQEPVSALVATRSQAALEGEIDREFAAAGHKPGVPARSSSSDLDGLRAAAARYARRLRSGRALGRIWLPSLGRRYVMVQGTDTGSLRKGPAHYPDTPLPGQGGTIAIAGHRTTYLAPFRTIDKLRPGDQVVLTMPYGRLTYRVRGTRIVRPEDVWVKRRVAYEQVILSACHPLYSAAKRIVVFARLVDAAPRREAAGARRRPVPDGGATPR